jgi:hypothetical protein
VQVCDKDAVQARITDASAWLSQKKKCIGYKRFMTIKFSLRDSSSGYGITRVSLFVKKEVAEFLEKYRCEHHISYRRIQVLRLSQLSPPFTRSGRC